MTERKTSALILAAVAAGLGVTAVAAEDAAAPEEVRVQEVEKALVDMNLIAVGQRSFVKCQACHMVGENIQRRAGPPLNGVVGRAAGTNDEFHYSPGMSKAATEGLVWTVEKLDAYLKAPREVVPGTTMGFPGIPKAEERAALIAYLASFKEDGSRVEGAPE